MKNSNDTIGNQTRDLPACSAVPQPTASPCHNILRFPAGARDFLPYQASRPAQGLNQRPVMWVVGTLGEVDLPPNAEVKNVWSCTCIRSYALIAGKNSQIYLYA